MQNIYEIPLPCGSVAIVDLVDADLVCGLPWRVHQGYVCADRYNWRISLRRLIAGPREDERIGHRNGDPLDNRRSNLKVTAVSRVEPSQRGRTSAYRGVSWATTKNRWLAYIRIDGRSRYLGRYTDEAQAARAYDRAALEAWGESARLNNV